MSNVTLLHRQALYLRPDPARVIVRPFRPTVDPKDLKPREKTRANHIVDRVLALDAADISSVLLDVLSNFEGRHRNLLRTCEARADEMESALAEHPAFTPMQRQLIGAYFLNEYSFEASALFNPSIVLHPDQSAAPAGGVRFVLSLRAVGEGHVSSLTFRSGSVTRDGSISVDPTARLAATPRLAAPVPEFDDGLPIEARFEGDDISERVLFPVTASQSNGIEDARFVLFEDEGRTTYYATYTAYDGRAIRSELIETQDFLSFRMTPLRGAAAVNKGMALFPRKIDGQFAMIGRQDAENLYLLRSDDILTWNGGALLLEPKYPWEFVQVGNCGSPIELEEGWLLFTHGVGPMRRYAIGAVLLDKQDPSRVLGRSREPLVYPIHSEREGYVPNVVYSCGAMLHGRRIILPYAVSDTFSNFATIRVDELLETLAPGA